MNISSSVFLGIICLLSGISMLSSCSEKPAVSLKIMSYNIRHGEGMDTILDLSRSADIIASVAPDYAALQEVDNTCSRTEYVNQTEFLATSTGMKGTFGKFMDFQGGAYGMSSLTSLSIRTTKILKLPDALYEPRSSIVQELEISDQCIIAIANVHFDWIGSEEGSKNRLKQAKALIQFLDSLKRPSIIIGDFNCTPDSPTMRYFESQGFQFVEKGLDNLSFQGNTKSEIDHVIFRNYGGFKFEVEKAYLLNEPIVSDHRPFIVEMKISY